MRLVHLLEHTSGFEDMHLREYARSDPTPMSLADALAYGASSRVCRWSPGTRMAYCSSGPAMMAAVIEKASGERFEDYMQEHIFKPLHMDTACYFYTPAVQQHLAKLYRPDGITPYPYWHIGLRPTAALNVSANDMANYLRFCLQRGSLDGTQVLQPASIERMETSTTMPSAKLGNMMNYGLCNYPVLEGPFVFHGHNGAVMGGIVQIEYLPDQGRGYVVMINSGNFNAAFKIRTLIRQYLIRGLTPPALPPVSPVSDEVKQHNAGYYQYVSTSVQWAYGFQRLLGVRRLVFITNGLFMTSLGVRNEKWVPMTGRLFRRENESMAEVALLPDADGEILIQCGFSTFKKISALRFWEQMVGAGLVSVLVVSSFVMVPVWIFRKLFCRKSRPVPLSVRIWPFVSAALLVAFDLLLVWGLRGIVTGRYVDDASLGTPCCLTVSIMLTSVAFPLAASASLYVAYCERTAPMKRRAYWHSVLVATAVVAVAIYYGYWGLIGLRLWA